MKKIIALILAIILTAAVLTACEEVEILQINTQIAFITDGGEVDDGGYNQNAWGGVIEYARSNNITYGSYVPENSSDEAKLAAIDEALEKSAKVIVCAGNSFENVIKQKRETNPELKFIIVDGDMNDKNNNTVALKFRAEEAGFIAGYMTVLDGFTKLGFAGESMNDDEIVRYGYGFVLGADQAAKELDVDVDIKYTYYAPAYDVWYANGTEVIFTCGDTNYQDALAYALEGQYFICSNYFEKEIMAGQKLYAWPSALTCATKSYKDAIYYVLEKNYTDAWGEVGGQTLTFGAKEGCISLPATQTETLNNWKFRNVTTADYADAMLKLRIGIYSLPENLTERQPVPERVSVDYNA